MLVVTAFSHKHVDYCCNELLAAAESVVEDEIDSCHVTPRFK